jgi:hypothetical protein
MYTNLKDFIQVLALLVASVGGVIAAFKAIAELNRGRTERREEFRWKQAEMAKKVLDETWSDYYARSALRMLDWSGSKYMDGERQTQSITHEHMWNALRTKNTKFDLDEHFIRDCFDHLFDCLERAEHFITINLIEFDDVKSRFEYYVKLMAKNRTVYEDFLETYNFKLAKRFLSRFEIWKAA